MKTYHNIFPMKSPPFITMSCILTLYFFLHLSSSFVAPKPTTDTDKPSLLEFKSRLDPKSSQILSSWNNTTPMCQWVGVKCGKKHQRVTSLSLKQKKLTGVISPVIGNLSFLRSLHLGDNLFRGQIPYEFGKLARLQYLNLSFNHFEGSIPSSLANCSNFQVLDLTSNHLSNHIPYEFGCLSNLLLLSFQTNNLTGKLPDSLGNLTSLLSLDLAYNGLEGEIPNTLSQLKSMSVLVISANKFSGVFPLSLYNLSSLVILALAGNNFFGTLRPDFGSAFLNLQVLYMAENQFSGNIPLSISNISGLTRIGMNKNKFMGNVPNNLGNLPNLEWLVIGQNLLGNYSVDDLDFLDSLSNCSLLENLAFHDNRFGGKLSDSITNLSSTLTTLLLGRNFITGRIPDGVSKFVNLNALGLEQNSFTGNIPDSIGNLINMKRLTLNSNNFTGNIPLSLGNIKGLLYLDLFNNSLEGKIPITLANCSNLLELGLSSNKLTGDLPSQVIGIASLLVLDLSVNSFTGLLPEKIGNLKGLYLLDVSHNKLSGEIPITLKNCLAMQFLDMQDNFFEGPIPDFSGMKGLRNLDFSMNKFSGPIPRYIADFQFLEYLNMSYNNFEGGVPIQGIFRNASAISVYGNTNLCGGIQEMKLSPCLTPNLQKSRKKHVKMGIIAVGAVIVASLLLIISAFILLYWSRKRRTENPTPESSFDTFYRKISYKELHIATDGFSSNNLIGSGHFGTVYKANIPQEINNTFAVKVLKLQQPGATKSFAAECETLKNVRHRNLVKIITACSGTDFQGNEFKALVYEFMPNGSLENWLHPEESTTRSLSVSERLNIVIDVAAALEYLHDSCDNSIVHCDLKPSNVLLDNELVARVSDFGLARLLSESGQESFTNQLSTGGIKGTLGYAAPEYGIGGLPSTRGDVYSFGILLLEIFTGKRPTDELFVDEVDLHSFVKSALQERILHIVDQSIFDIETMETENFLAKNSKLIEGLVLIFQIGVDCTERSDRDRMEMKNVSKELVSIRGRLFGTKA